MTETQLQEPSAPRAPAQRPQPVPAAAPALEADAARLTLDDLAAMTSADLEACYRQATVPADLTLLSGRPRGRMLAVRGTEGTPLAAWLRGLARHPRFPWGGKTFGSETAGEGTGINRVRLGGLRLDLYPFRTSVAPSLVDGLPCVVLDYAQPGNPWFIRRIHDEIREVAAGLSPRPGLFLGPAMWKDDAGGAAHVLWFAVDFASQEPAA